MLAAAMEHHRYVKSLNKYIYLEGKPATHCLYMRLGHNNQHPVGCVFLESSLNPPVTVEYHIKFEQRKKLSKICRKWLNHYWFKTKRSNDYYSNWQLILT